MIRILALLACSLALAACADLPYRTTAGTCRLAGIVDSKGSVHWESSDLTADPCAQSWSIEVTEPAQFSLNFVEIDEQGMPKNRAQAEDAIRTAAAPETNGSYVVVFVHGWHHDPSAGDGNVQGFYDALASIKRWHPEKKVKGIYVGWRGDSLPVPGLRYLTFWDRKSTSDEVGRGGLLEFLLRLERETKPDADSKNRLVVVGHSFGASVTFNALAHLYMERFMDGVYAPPNARPRFRGYGDLVVLINPAIEAMRYMPFQSALEYYSAGHAPAGRRIDFSNEKRPYLVMLSSEGDWATRKVFPAARFFSTALEAHNSHVSARAGTVDGQDDGGYSEWQMDVQAVGNLESFHTHETIQLDSRAEVSPNQTLRRTAQDAEVVEQCRPLPPGKVRENLSVDAASGPDPTNGVPSFPDSLLIAPHKPGAIPGSPYLAATVSSRIVRDHTSIGNQNLICWINQLVDAD